MVKPVADCWEGGRFATWAWATVAEPRTQNAAMAAATRFARPSGEATIELIELSLARTTVGSPSARQTYTDIERPIPCNMEYDPNLYCPPDVYRKPSPISPTGCEIDIERTPRAAVVAGRTSAIGTSGQGVRRQGNRMGCDSHRTFEVYRTGKSLQPPKGGLTGQLCTSSGRPLLRKRPLCVQTSIEAIF